MFPNFGPWDLGPQHGFARTSRWTVAKAPVHTSDGKAVEATFELEDNETTRQMWDHKFKLQYVVTLTAESFSTRFVVQNTGGDAFSFTCLLHTYFRVPKVDDVTVSGLKGLQYVDKVDGGKRATEERDLVTIASTVDRVYEKTGSEHVISNVAAGRTVVLIKENLPDTVVWNPWKEKAAAMADMGNDDYPNMICVEAGYVSEKKQLAAGETFMCGQTIQARL